MTNFQWLCTTQLTHNWIKSPIGVWFYVFWTWGRWLQTNLETCVDFWTSDALLVLFAGVCVSTGLMAFFFFFFFRKTSSWPCVWNYTPGSKQGRLTEKKTAVRQWITVLWPDKCRSEDWMRKLGARQESHIYTHTLSHVHIRTYCMHTCSYPGAHEGDATTKLRVFLLGLKPAIFYSS